MFFSLVLLLLPSTIYVHATCQPFYTTFASLEGFTPMDSPRQYSFSDDGLELYMRKPRGPVKSSKGVNDKVGEGATFNSTFVMSQGKATFEVTAPKVAGLVTAVVMISTGDSGDEIDIELLGGDPDHWQTNIYAPPYPGAPPEYGTYSSIEDVGDIGGMHAYTIDWNEERIQWSLDGRVARTLIVHCSTNFSQRPVYLSDPRNETPVGNMGCEWRTRYGGMGKWSSQLGKDAR